MATSTTSAALNIDSIEWEVINDNGFVYKRQKRRVDPTSLARAQPQPQDPEPDPAILLKQRTKKKRQALLKLKEKYERELSHWENLSNTLNAMQNTANSKHNQVMENAGEGTEMGNNNNNGFQSVGEVDKFSGSLVDQLRMQVEAQEAVIRNFEQICDAADSLCNVYEEKSNQQYFDLPTLHLDSPRELMASLCED